MLLIFCKLCNSRCVTAALTLLKRDHNSASKTNAVYFKALLLSLVTITPATYRLVMLMPNHNKVLSMGSGYNTVAMRETKIKTT